MLNAKELVDKKIITGPIGEDCISQHGIDLNLIQVSAIKGIGHIPKKGKTQLPSYSIQSLKKDKGKNQYWHLTPGCYDVVFAQGCNIPADQMLLIRQRSSVLRSGAFIHSSVFDAGFRTDNIGTMMIVVHPIEIEYGARVCQIYNHETTPVENLYDGQFQNDKQRIK